ncbi:MAG: EfeM/EfeO family lipoprotein [Anaerolineales bacterium]|nr:EfeM/EfeO family lipoprotein [Anaerolineales bacterium]
MVARITLLSLLLLGLLAACAAPATPANAPAASSAADLSGVKSYLLDKGAALSASASDLQTASARYYDLAQTTGFDYATLAADPAQAAQTLSDAKTAWLAASPLYEQMEGIVAGVPSLSDFDLILDAGASGAQDPENAAPYDLTLPDGRVLERPGNVFGVLESALWGTEPAFKGADADLDASGTQDFGESLPDANVLKAAADALVDYSAQLRSASQDWQPSESEAFTALVVMVPTMNEYFNSWKSSRFVSGEEATQRDFVAISRLADMQDILASLQVVYSGVKPLAESVNADQAAQIENGLADLKSFVAGVHSQEQGGKRFSAEEADILGAEAQNRATALAGQISQVAAQLNIEIDG